MIERDQTLPARLFVANVDPTPDALASLAERQLNSGLTLARSYLGSARHALDSFKRVNGARERRRHETRLLRYLADAETALNIAAAARPYVRGRS